MYFPEKADPTPVEKRSDDRFAVQSRVTVTPLNEPSRKMDTLLADVSATGFRLILPEALASGTRVVVELESHIALAEVRYLYPRGDKFATGAMKLASVLRLELPDDATWEQKVRKLLKESSVGSTDFVAAPQVSAEEPPPPEAGMVPMPVISMPRLSRPAMVPLPKPAVLAAAVAVSAPAQTGANFLARNSNIAVAPADVPVLALLENSNDEDSVALKIDSCETTQELPKISESTVEAVATVDVRPHSRSRLGMVSAAAVACLLAVAAASYIWRPAQGSPNKSAAPAPIVKKPEVSAPVAAVPVKPAEAQSPAPAAAIRQVPVPASAVSASAPPTITTRALTGARKAAIESDSMNWVSVCSDTQAKTQRLLQAGDRLDFSFNQQAVLRMGNSGASAVSVDGKSIGPVGAPASPRVILLKPAGFEYATNLPVDGSADCPTP